MSVYVKTSSGADLLTKSANEFTLLYDYPVGSTNSTTSVLMIDTLKYWNMLFMEFSFNDSLQSIRTSLFIDTSTIASDSYSTFVLTFPYNFDNTSTAGIMTKKVKYEKAAYVGSDDDRISCEATYILNIGSTTMTETSDYIYPRYLYGIY